MNLRCFLFPDFDKQGLHVARGGPACFDLQIHKEVEHNVVVSLEEFVAVIGIDEHFLLGRDLVECSKLRGGRTGGVKQTRAH